MLYQQSSKERDFPLTPSLPTEGLIPKEVAFVTNSDVSSLGLYPRFGCAPTLNPIMMRSLSPCSKMLSCADQHTPTATNTTNNAVAQLGPRESACGEARNRGRLVIAEEPQPSRPPLHMRTRHATHSKQGPRPYCLRDATTCSRVATLVRSSALVAVASRLKAARLASTAALLRARSSDSE